MIISKRYIENILNETCEEFSKKVRKIDKIEIKFVDKEYFLSDARKTLVNQTYIQKGIISDFDKEYPGFMVVYGSDKNLISLMLSGSYKISICFEIARERLKPFTSKQVREYLKHGFAHEIGHIYQDALIEKYNELWAQALLVSKGNDELAKEDFVESIADMVCKTEEFKHVEDMLWSKIISKTKKMYGLNGKSK